MHVIANHFLQNKQTFGQFRLKKTSVFGNELWLSITGKKIHSLSSLCVIWCKVNLSASNPAWPPAVARQRCDWQGQWVQVTPITVVLTPGGVCQAAGSGYTHRRMVIIYILSEWHLEGTCTHACTNTRSVVRALQWQLSLRCFEVWADQEVTSRIPRDYPRSKVRGIRAASAINGATVRVLKRMSQKAQIQTPVTRLQRAAEYIC